MANNCNVDINLTQGELDLISTILGREPRDLELELFSRLWSEHASYKNSLKWVRMLPSEGEHVIVGAGDESAGAVDIGDGYACVFKMESHNHPCSVQPRLGALTGMRVVTRDVFSMGAKPVAILESMRFGSSQRETARWLFSEVMSGIKEYEETLKVPIVDGEIYFGKGFNHCPIVNNMAVGVAKSDNLISGTAKGIGNKIIVLGSLTGCQGVDADPFSNEIEFEEGSDPLFDFEQMMDTTVEKNLLSAIAKLNKGKYVVGIHSIGTGGVAAAAAEMAKRGESSVEINLDKIPVNEESLDLRSRMFSDSWGRILLCVDKDKVAEVLEVLAPKQLAFAVIGEVVEGNSTLRCMGNDEVVTEIPVDYVGLGGAAPIYEREIQAPDPSQRPIIDIESVEEPESIKEVIDVLMDNLNLSSKRELAQQLGVFELPDGYAVKLPSDAAFVDLEDVDKTIAITIDSNPNYVEADPFVGSKIAVAEAARNLVCGGAKPLAVTDCLNYGDPYDPEVFWQFTESINGLSEACTKFNTPVVSGNVSFYNQSSEDGAIDSVVPSPIIGMVGVLKDKKRKTYSAFTNKGDVIYLIGKSRDDINGSQYLTKYHKKISYKAPYFDEDEELALHDTLEKIIQFDFANSVHDISIGGLFFNLLDSSAPTGLGFDITSDAEVRTDSFLFGEAQGRAVVTISEDNQDDFVDFMLDQDVPFSVLGHVTKGEIRIDDESYGFIEELGEKYYTCIQRWMSNNEG